PEYEFMLAIKGKSEQFRARNAIVKQALQTDSDYILMLDDDHILDIQDSQGPSEGYDFLRTLLEHMELNPQMGICGALYVQRGGDQLPVVMNEGEMGPHFLTPMEISGQLQQVDITGGGCMLIRKEVFYKVPEPWFAPEFEYGTDIQICKKAREAGYTVFCDTSLEIGHVKLEKQIITPSKVGIKTISINHNQLDMAALADNYAMDYTRAVCKYAGKNIKELEALADTYDASLIKNYDSKEEYYKQLGTKQLARNFIFNCGEGKVKEALSYIELLKDSKYAYGLDYCCGSAPVGFEILKNGKSMDFVDIDGAASYEFAKWRVRRSNGMVGADIFGPYDFVLMLDAIEHLEDWEAHLESIDVALKPGGLFVTNYFTLYDYDNPEHINMDKYRVEAFLIHNGYKFINPHVWAKR
ncbi:methyltransferase domain-containing protein, partial [bacterium]|nr:methyltransferase domain-containing protein [bacterium]